jgi:acetyl esterase/lipase
VAAALTTGCDDAITVRVERGVDVHGVTVTDVYTSGGEAGRPVVVMLHGGDGDPDRMGPLAEAVAQRGAVVYVPTWPIHSRRLAGDALDFALHDEFEAVVCALRHARRTASEHGGDPDDITLLGHSAGGFVGAAVAMVAEPPWAAIGCDIDVDHRPQRFIGTSGDYTGSTFPIDEFAGLPEYARSTTDVVDAYDPFVLEATNRDLDVRLLHGFGDDIIFPDAAFELRDRLVDQGLDARLLTVDVSHGDPVTPGPSMDFVADQIAGLLTRQATAFEPELTGTLAFDRDRCTYDGPSGLTVAEAVAVDLRNDSDAPLMFGFVTFDSWRPADDGTVLDGGPRQPFDEPPGSVRGQGFVPVPPRTTGTVDWALVDSARPWVLYCLPLDDHPAAGLLHGAAEVVPLGGPERF